MLRRSEQTIGAGYVAFVIKFGRPVYILVIFYKCRKYFGIIFIYINLNYVLFDIIVESICILTPGCELRSRFWLKFFISIFAIPFLREWKRSGFLKGSRSSGDRKNPFVIGSIIRARSDDQVLMRAAVRTVLRPVAGNLILSNARAMGNLRLQTLKLASLNMPMGKLNLCPAWRECDLRKGTTAMATA